MTVISRTLAVVVSASALVALSWASQYPWRAPQANQSVLRLAWSARPERVERCTEPTQAELAKVPQHMRLAVVCTGESASYRLVVTLDGIATVDQRVRGGGLRHDRQLYVFRDLPLEPREVDIDVQFTRIDSGSAAKAPGSRVEPDTAGGANITPLDGHSVSRPAHEAELRQRERDAAVPPALRLTQRVAFRGGQVVLVKYDDTTRQLVAVSGTGN